MEKYDSFVSLFTKSDGSQYYFPKSDIHITAFEFVSSRPDFWKYARDIQLFNKVSKDIILKSGRFKVDLIGTVFTRGSGFIAGIDGGRLTEIREKIRIELKKSGFEPLERYRSNSAHISFMAFQNKPKSEEKLLSLIEKTKEMDLGSIEVSTIELVEHDWYSRAKNRKTIAKYEL